MPKMATYDKNLQHENKRFSPIKGITRNVTEMGYFKPILVTFLIMPLIGDCL